MAKDKGKGMAKGGSKFRALLQAGTVVATILGTAACDRAPEVQHQSVEVTMRGNGRDIAAAFAYTCRLSEYGPYSLYRPDAESYLYIAPDREALLLSYPQPRDPTLCDQDAIGEQGPAEPHLPAMLWIDDISSPAQVDRIGTSTPSAHRRFSLPELVHFAHRATADPASAAPNRGRMISLGETYRSLDAGRAGGGPRMISAARRKASVQFADSAEREAFAALLGSAVAPGVRTLDLCDLAATADGRDYLTREAPQLVAGCPRRPVVLPAQRIRFSVPLAMKRISGDRWMTGGGEAVVSYVLDARTPVSMSAADADRPMARSPEFWRSDVRTVSWIDAGGAELPAASPVAYFLEGGDQMVLFLGDVEVVYFRSPLTWLRR